MPNIIKLTSENADELLNTGAYAAGAVIRLQTSATETGAYADVSGTGSTPTTALVSGTRIYTAYDPNGTSSSWYRTRYENVGATRLSDWTAAFQVGDETAGLLCSIYDAKQRLFPSGSTSTAEDENLLDYIRQASAFLERETGRWFYPRPLSGTTTYRFHTTFGRLLSVRRGIRSITTLGIAAFDQPATGGTYITADSAGYFIDSPDIDRDSGWPGVRIGLTWPGANLFYNASYGAEVVGAFGFASVPYDVQSAALDLVVAMHQGRGSGGVGGSFTINIDGSRTFDRLPDSVRRVITFYRTPNVA